MLRRRMLIMLGVVLLVVLLLGGYKGFSIYQQIQSFSVPKPPISVAVASAAEQPWQSRLPTVGSLKALQGVDLSLEIAGTVQKVLFQSGQKVKAGQPLLQLDSEVESALLETAEADLGLSQLDFGRGRQLVGSQAISKGEFDRLSAQLKKNQATVNQLKASLDKKRIVAPFSGTIGIRQVDVGDYLASGTVIATLQDLSSLYVDFYVPEQTVPRLAVAQPVNVGVPAYPGQTFVGAISAINPKVEDSTRNVLVRATLANPDGKLLPGMFANLQVILPDVAAGIVVPETAVTYTLYGNSMYVVTQKKAADGNVEKDDKGQPVLIAERRFVETGERRDGLVLVTKGVQSGEQVVIAGQIRLDNGTHIAISDDKTLTEQNSPRSAD
ncbi:MULTISPECIES: efflux RND transporter periplasmic adaptor subunit [unclassified Pseudomonas]|uniref:efflux RND transporter periplasmic adaptor subunit n=1 Tax=unclassified Pseudomonas TaxID=196821 RepID=UPI00119B5554|nr:MULTISPECIES: efflux RND transporter periplasmic adaptor subunit [unclassified Pseudomonas]TWC20577.1 membrane fusion protein (multidrug efflux system) [Pseudomonas sp. SJZ075]TWC25543.1 membrane fusion protein (multidrug efflux system) [Pseudomonas sp. SJZ074]TWC36007.1 membrane fusion protein (multidrug efflux system) [Pseudomonas sp. SJZ078]TWC42354.1 membrane fusion protein (multidrug efflux system) [Pseudomonas sp. SJZ085]TWC56875.1 membrane fusion protein (multidrug efflux system) [Ps